MSHLAREIVSAALDFRNGSTASFFYSENQQFLGWEHKVDYVIVERQMILELFFETCDAFLLMAVESFLEVVQIHLEEVLLMLEVHLKQEPKEAEEVDVKEVEEVE
jgi:hypothetical protein